MNAYKFRAFVSYSRSDRPWAKSLQSRLERYVLPHALRLINPGMRHDRRPLKPIFRDEDELVPGQGLPERIRKGLEQSDYLIVVCSPRSAASEWVSKEILDFIALGRQDNILAVVVDGTPNAESHGLAPEQEALPRELRFEPDLTKDEAGKTVVSISSRPAEPLWVDWRKNNHRSRPMFLRLVAALLELSSLDELIRKDQAYRRKRAALMWSLASVAVFCIGALGIDLKFRDDQAESRALAVEALQGGGDPVIALKKAVQAAEIWPTEEAEVALNTVLDGPIVRVILHQSSSEGASDDGTKLITSTADGAISVWDATTGRVLARLAAPAPSDVQALMSPDGERILATYLPSGAVGAPKSIEADSVLWDASGHRIADLGILEKATFSPDSKLMVTVGTGGPARLWSTADGILQRTLSHSSGEAVWMAFSEDSNFVRAIYSDRHVRVWDSHTGSLVSELTLPHDEATDNNDLADGQFSPDGKLLIATDYVVKLFDAHGRLSGTLAARDCGMISAMFSPDGKQVATLDAHGEVEIWDVSTLQKKAQTGLFTTPSAPASGSLQFSPSGAFLLSINGDVATLWNTTNGQRMGTLLGHTGALSSARFLGRGDRIATASADGTVRIWDWQGDRAVLNFACSAIRPATMQDVPILALMGVGSSAEWTAISAKNGVAASFANGGACLWDMKNGQPIAVQKAAGYIRRGAFSSDGARIATVGWLGRSIVWDGKTLEPRADVACGKGGLNDLEFSPDAKRMVAACGNGAVEWTVSNPGGRAFIGHTAAVNRAVFSNDNKRVVTASDDGTARVWDTGTRKSLAVLKGHMPVMDAEFSPDGRRVVTASADGTARLWDSASGQLLTVLRGHVGAVKTAVFSGDGRRVVTAGEDHTARVWDAGTGNLLVTLEAGSDVTEATFSPNGKYVLTVDSGEVRVWTLGDGRARQLPAIDGDFAQFTPDSRQVLVIGVDGITSLYTIDMQQLVERAKQLFPIDSRS